MDVLSQLLQHAAEGDDFLSNIVTGNESWLHHFDPKTKPDNMECHHTASSRKKARTILSAGNSFLGC
jgi:hypothetical protein